MFASERVRKAQKFYRDFPVLWAVEPYCNHDLDLKVVEMDGELLSNPAEANKRWWVHFRQPGIVDAITEIEHGDHRNLASAVIETIGMIILDIDVPHLFSMEQSAGFKKTILIHKRAKHTTILNACVCRGWRR